MSTVQVTGAYSGMLGNGQGVLSLTLTKNGAFIGKLQAGSTIYTLAGQFDANGNYTTTLAKGTIPLTLHLGWNAITGSAGATPLIAGRSTAAVYGSAAESGTYTALLTAISSATTGVPTGTGYATLIVTKTGLVSISGKLADGAAFASSGPLLTGSAYDQYPLYVSGIYPNGGSVSGVITFEKLAQTQCDGTLGWVKPSQTGSTSYFGGGFNASVSFAGSTYAKPVTTGTVQTPNVLGTSATNAVLTFSGGGLTAPVTANVSLLAGGAMQVTGTTGISVSLSAATGLVSGSFIPPLSTAAVKFGGAIDQSASVAAGFFLGPLTSGTGASGTISIK
jgi:hypothetical protein